MESLNNVLRIAEWKIGSQEDLIAFERKLLPIFKGVEDLRLALGEKVTSIDIEVNVVQPGVPFDHRCMQDGYGDLRRRNMKTSDEVVAGTTGIGLKKVLPSPSGEERFDSILSPKVALISTLEDVLPPSPLPPLPPRSHRGQSDVIQDGREKLLPPQPTTPSDIHYSIELTNPQPTSIDNEHVSLLADSAMTILDGTGAAPVLDVIHTMLELRKEMEKVSNFLAYNIKQFSYELFQEELDRCHQDSERMVGARLSEFLREHSEAEKFSQPLVKITIQLFMVWFCAGEWENYLDQQRGAGLRVGEYY
jgi:hypothetical protein